VERAGRQHAKGGHGADVVHKEANAQRLQRRHPARVRTPRRRRRAVHGRAAAGRRGGAWRPGDERRRRLAALVRLVLLQRRLVRVGATVRVKVMGWC
jgi:hypothetical protein